MSGPLIIGVGVVYLIIAVDLYFKGQGGLALAFAGYSVSNIGLWLAAR